MDVGGGGPGCSWLPRVLPSSRHTLLGARGPLNIYCVSPSVIGKKPPLGNCQERLLGGDRERARSYEEPALPGTLSCLRRRRQRPQVTGPFEKDSEVQPGGADSKYSVNARHQQT